ncbi:hypothetical protein ACS0TY_012527 [Phlomoides rotata]
MPGIAFGRVDDSFSAASIKAYIAGFISTLLFVVGSAIAYKKLTSAALDPAGLMAIAVCHGLALFVAIAIAGNISGGHVNPAVTFDLAVGGQITILTGLFYWIAQLLGAIVASFLLKVVTGGLCNSTSSGGVSKKPRVQQSSPQPAQEVRKEKSGDRISALHQLVSPFGKTDTTSVLSEALATLDSFRVR